VGELPAAGASLITVMDTSQVIAKAHVSQEYAAQVKLGAAATITATGVDAPVAGKVTQVSPALDPNSTTVEIWVTAKNPAGQLRPGSAAKIAIETKRAKGALAVPEKALVTTEDGKQEVAVVSGDTAEMKPVETGIADATAGLVQVTSGLKAGDVVVNNAYGLPDKVKVKIDSGQPAKSNEDAKGDKGE